MLLRFVIKVGWKHSDTYNTCIRINWSVFLHVPWFTHKNGDNKKIFCFLSVLPEERVSAIVPYEHQPCLSLTSYPTTLNPIICTDRFMSTKSNPLLSSCNALISSLRQSATHKLRCVHTASNTVSIWPRNVAFHLIVFPSRIKFCGCIFAIWHFYEQRGREKWLRSWFEPFLSYHMNMMRKTQLKTMSGVRALFIFLFFLD